MPNSTRHGKNLRSGRANPRVDASAGQCTPLLRCARARALLDGRHYFTHEDVQAVALGVLGHRLMLRPEAEVEGRRVSDIVKDVLAEVPVLETA